MTLDCRCEALGYPLASFCADDLYCPQCGEPVAWIGSPNFQPDPASADALDVLWVYSTRRKDEDAFRFLLTFCSLDDERRPTPRPLERDSFRCHLSGLDHWFEHAVEVRVGEDLPSGAVECTLRPKPPLANRNGDGLKKEGVPGQLELDGNCGRHKLPLLVFSAPKFRCEVAGVADSAGQAGSAVQAGSEPDHWILGSRGDQRLSLTLWPSTALLYVPPPAPGFDLPTPIAASFAYTLESSPWDESEQDRGIRLGPDAPARFLIEFNTEDWPSEEDEEQEGKSLTVFIPTRVPHPLEKTLTFRRRAQGDLTPDPGWSFTLIPPVYYGERFTCPHDVTTGLRLAEPLPTRQVTLHNSGEHALRVAPPEVRYLEGPPGVRWLSAELEEPDGSGQIARGDVGLDIHWSCKMHIGFDLRKLTPENHPPGKPLRADVLLRDADGDRTWKLNVEIPRLEERPGLSNPIVIDFGATNTFAAVADDRVAGRVAAVLGLPTPEHFPTALFLTSTEDSDRDPGDRGFEIGREAISLAFGRGDRLVRGLKRGLARSVVPNRAGSKSNVHGHDYRDITRKFLGRVLRECEANCRGTATRLALSYPANSSPRAIQELEHVIKDLEVDWRHCYPKYAEKIRFSYPLDADEATAVAMGFVLDHAHVDAEGGVIRRLREAGKNPFYVASFDFGGGSIDIALIRFHFRGEPGDVLDYESAFVGIGGDEVFGGDNVTLACYELLARGILGVLASPDGPRRVSLPLADLDDSYFLTGSGPRAENTWMLWEAAEALKRATCNTTPVAIDQERLRNALEALSSRLAIEVQGDGPVRSVPLDEAQRRAIDEAGRADPPFGITPEAIYNHEIAQVDFNGNSGYSVRRRLEQCVKKLQGYAKRAEAAGGRPAPDVIVMAGASCRLPLAREVLTDAFPEAVDPATAGSQAKSGGATFYVVDHDHAKSKVAFGVARYLDLLDRGRADGLARARDYTHADLVWEEDTLKRRIWVPGCSRLGGDTWFPLPSVSFLHCRRQLDSRWVVEVHRNTYPSPEPLGFFDLSEPGRPPEAPRPDDPVVLPELPVELPTRSPDNPDQVYLRLGPTADSATLRVRLGETWYGDWTMRPFDDLVPNSR